MAIATWPPSAKGWKVIGLCLAGLILVGFVLFAAEKCNTYRDNKEINKLAANVKAAKAELANAQANVQADNVDIAVKVEKVKEATNAAVIAVNATDAQKAEVNKALANIAKDVAANRPVGTTGDDLDKKLTDLGIQ